MIIEKGSQLKKISFSPPSHYIKNANYQILIIYKKFNNIQEMASHPIKRELTMQSKETGREIKGNPRL